MKVDVVICAGTADINNLFIYSVKSCIAHFTLLNNIYVITPIKDQAINRIHNAGLCWSNIYIMSDDEVIDKSLLANEDGWYIQQIIKLNAHKFCTTRFIAYLSSDTILLQPIGLNHLFDHTYMPYIFYNADITQTKHYLYEQQRIRTSHVKPEDNFLSIIFEKASCMKALAEEVVIS